MGVEAVRDYASGLGGERTGWLGGLRASQIGRALVLLHGSIDTDCTTDRLAREVYMSRSAFNEGLLRSSGRRPFGTSRTGACSSAREKLQGGRQIIAHIAHAVG